MIFKEFKGQLTRANWDKISQEAILQPDGSYHQGGEVFLRGFSHFKGGHQFEAGVHMSFKEYQERFGPDSQIDDFGRDIGSIKKPKRRL